MIARGCCASLLYYAKLNLKHIHEEIYSVYIGMEPWIKKNFLCSRFKLFVNEQAQQISERFIVFLKEEFDSFVQGGKTDRIWTIPNPVPLHENHIVVGRFFQWFFRILRPFPEKFMDLVAGTQKAPTKFHRVQKVFRNFQGGILVIYL